MSPNTPYFFYSPILFHDGIGRPNRYIGVELEISGVEGKFKPVADAVAKWSGTIGTDNTLPIQTGFEIRTCPAKGDAFIKQINEICSALVEQKAFVTNACGLHVHVDARDFKSEDKAKLGFVWSNVEERMFKRVASHRLGGGWCYPHNMSLLGFIEKTDTKQQLQSKMLNSVNASARMHSLNFTALQKHGTVENRMHEGSFNAKEIISWAKLNSWIIDYAKRSGFDAIIDGYRLSELRAQNKTKGNSGTDFIAKSG